MSLPAPTPSDVKEVRIALAFFGGVALAVYESGVALEFFRLVKGEGVYAKLHEKLGPVMVDIITGTSAGGLNGAFLANALVNRGDMGQLLTLWREEGDLGKLLYSPWKVGPQSLLDGERFLKRIFEALQRKRAAPAEERFLQPYLDLYITATNLDGDRVVIKTPLSGPIATRTHQQVFRFRYQQADPQRDLRAINDFQTEEDLWLLARAARATASFPLAFEPVLIEKAALGSRAAHLEADAYHIDGGVLDNKPIAKALEAIAQRRADKQVQRLLFYIEPDPELVESRVGQIAARPPQPATVVLKALVGLPSYQSLTGALQDIEQHNRQVVAVRRTLDYYENAAAKFRAQQSETSSKAQRYVSPTDGPTALFRAQEDGYLDLRLQRDLSSKILQLCAALTDDTATTTPTLVGESMAFAIKPTVYQIKNALLETLDLTYTRRMCRYLVQVMRALYPPIPAGLSQLEQERLLRVMQQLNMSKDFLYQQEERVIRYQDAQRDQVHAVLAEVEGHLQVLYEHLRFLRLTANPEIEEVLHTLHREVCYAPQAVRSAWEIFWRQVCEEQQTSETAITDLQHAFVQYQLLPATLEQLLARLRTVLPQLEALQHQARQGADALYDRLTQHDVLRQRRQFFSELCQTIRQKMQSDTDELQRVIQRHGGQDDAVYVLCTGIDHGFWKLRDALESFYLRDMMIYPLMQGTELAAELQPVNVARVSPADADHYLPGLAAADKVAGEKFAHFGGFFSADWRGNDVTWGRLDAVEIIFRKLLPGKEWDAERREWIRQAQEHIVKEMHTMGMGIFHQTTGEPQYQDLIGRDDLTAIPASLKINWAVRGAITLLKIGRKSWADTKVASFVPKVTAAFDYAINALTALFLLITFCSRFVWRWRILRLVLGIVLCMGLGIVLWNYSLHDLWNNLRPR
jgi:patatin-related protein